MIVFSLTFNLVLSFFVGTVVFTSAVFWLINIFFIVLDVTGKPAVLLRYKVQPDKNRPVSLSDEKSYLYSPLKMRFRTKFDTPYNNQHSLSVQSAGARWMFWMLVDIICLSHLNGKNRRVVAWPKP